MAEALSSLVEYGQQAAAEPEASTVHRDAGIHSHSGACWELDVSHVISLAHSVARGEVVRADWAEELLAGTRIVDVNQNTVHLIGAYAGRDGMIGRSVAAFWPPESGVQLAELIVAVAADQPRHAARSREISSLILRDAMLTAWGGHKRGQPDRICVALDGGLKESRSLWSLRASEERYLTLLHHLPCAVLQIDARAIGTVFDRLRGDGVTDIGAYLNDHPELIETAQDIIRVTDINRTAMRLLGASDPAEFIRPVNYLFAASPETARRIMIAHFDGRREYAEVMKLPTFDGRLLDVQISVTYPTRPERLDVILIRLEDVTDRLRTEAQLRQLQADYTWAARISTLGELATSIAHEVNQPLSAIVTNAETSLRWLSRDHPNLAKVSQLTARIAESARRASDIVLRIRRMAAKHEPERIALDLNKVVDEALLFVRHDIESRAIGLSVMLAPDLSRIAGDRVQLHQVVVNLLVNSLQAIDQTGETDRRIELATYAGENGGVGFSIHDSGAGIVDRDLDRVFDGFFTTKRQGVGIGLAICQSIITAHGGSIAVSNHPDGGAHFRFWLPGGPGSSCVYGNDAR